MYRPRIVAEVMRRTVLDSQAEVADQDNQPEEGVPHPHRAARIVPEVPWGSRDRDSCPRTGLGVPYLRARSSLEDAERHPAVISSLTLRCHAQDPLDDYSRVEGYPRTAEGHGEEGG